MTISVQHLELMEVLEDAAEGMPEMATMELTRSQVVRLVELIHHLREQRDAHLRQIEVAAIDTLKAAGFDAQIMCGNCCTTYRENERHACYTEGE